MKTVEILYGLVLVVPVLAAAQDHPPINPLPGRWVLSQNMPGAMAGGMSGQMAERMKQWHGVTVDPKTGELRRAQCLKRTELGNWPQLLGMRGGMPGMMGNAASTSMGMGMGAIGASAAAAYQGCGDASYSREGNTLTIERTCRGRETVTVRSVYRFSPRRDSYTFEQSMKLPSGEEWRHGSGSAKRIGGC